MRNRKNIMHYRISALLLALITIVSALCFSSCGNTDKPVTTSDTTAAATPVSEDTQAIAGPAEETTAELFQKVDYQGSKFVVWQHSYDASSYASLYIENFTEDISDLMSQAVFKRNSQLEDFFNIDLEVRNAFSINSFSVQLQGGALDVDIILDIKNNIGRRVTIGELQPFENLEVDYTTPWWSEKSLKDFEISGYSYLASNDVSVYRFCGARFFYWNKRIVADYHLDNPYDLMKENKWDVEHFLTMVKGVSTDNGFSGLGEYGLLLETGESNGVFAHMAAGCGITLTESRDGEIVITIDEQADKISTLFSKLKTTFSDMYCVMDFSLAQVLDTLGESAGSIHMFQAGRKLFAAGHFLFTQTNLSSAYIFVDMKDEYGVAPNPKYNSDQENYIHKDDPYSLIWAIPNSSTIDLTRLGRVMDYWSYVSSQTVIPDYYEITIKTKRAYEAEAGKVIDIVRDTTYSEFSEVMGVGLAGVLNDAYSSGSIGSSWAKKKESIQKSIDAFNEWEPY